MARIIIRINRDRHLGDDLLVIIRRTRGVALDRDGKQRLRLVGILGIVGRGRVGGVQIAEAGVAAPAQGQRLAVRQAGILDLQLRLHQLHNVDAVLGRVVADKAVIAAVVIAAVINIRSTALIEAELIGFGIVKDRVDLPALHVDLDTDRGIQQRGVVDVIAQQLLDQRVMVARGSARAVIVERGHVLVQFGLGAAHKGFAVRVDHGDVVLEVVARAALLHDLLAERIQPPRRLHPGQGDLRRLEQRAGVGLVLFKPGQPRVGDQPAADQHRQNGRDSQNDHQLHQRKAFLFVFYIFIVLHHRCSRRFSGERLQLDTISHYIYCHYTRNVTFPQQSPRDFSKFTPNIVGQRQVVHDFAIISVSFEQKAVFFSRNSLQIQARHGILNSVLLYGRGCVTMLAARLGAWLRHTGERWAKAAFAEKLAVLLALGAVLYTIVTGAAELRYQARAREALAQVKAARLAACAVSAQCYSAGQTFADQTSADGFADGIAEEIRTLGSLPGTVTLLQIDTNGYTVQRLLYQENGMYAVYDADGGYRVFRAEDRLQYGAGVGHAAA